MTNSPHTDRDQDRAGNDRDSGVLSPAEDSAASVVRSEEQLQVRTETAATERVRLVKRIVTENVTITVPVSHEKVTLERIPVTDTNRGDAADGVELTEHAWDLVLYTEQIQVTKVTVPVERVQLSKRIITEQEQVSDTLRKEQVDLDTYDVDQTPSAGS